MLKIQQQQNEKVDRSASNLQLTIVVKQRYGVGWKKERKKRKSVFKENIIKMLH